MRYVSFSWFNTTLKRYVWLYAELMVIAIAIRLLLLVEPFVFQALVDRVLPFQRTATLHLIVALLTASALFQVGLNVVSGLLANLTANRVTNELGERLYEHLLQLPLGFYHRWPVGEVMARIDEIDTIRNFMVGTATGVTLDVMFAFIYIGALYSISPELTVIVVLALPVQAAIYLGLGPFLRARIRASFDASAAYQANMVESLAGATVAKAMAIEKSVARKLMGTLGRVLSTNLRTEYVRMASDQLVYLVQRSVVILVLFVGSGMIFESELTLGQLIAFFLLTRRVSGPIASFSRLWEAWQNIRISRQRLADILLEDRESVGSLPRVPSRRFTALRLENVTFGYGGDAPVVENLSVDVLPERSTVIVGPSGVGKSTVGKLLAGLLHPEHGRLVVNGEDGRRFDPRSVRRTVMYVPQEPVLFSGSVRENLLLGRGEAGITAIERALELSASTNMLGDLARGLDTDVGERGMNLSGGQRQRIAIARALLLGPRVLVLDEPTSALDVETQGILVRNMVGLTPDITVVFITHQHELIPGPVTIVDLAKRKEIIRGTVQAIPRPSHGR